MLDLYFIRHGESEANLKPDFVGGRSDHVHLTENGKKQAELLGERLARTNTIFDKVYSSIANRAYETAIISCQKIGYSIDDIILSEEIVELNQGNWEGKPRKEVYTPEILKIINSNRWTFKAPNGESQKDVEERMYNWLEKEILDLSDNDCTIGIYSHGFAIKCLFRKIMNSDPHLTYQIQIDNTSITKFTYNQRKFHNLVFLNDVSHLEKR